MKKKAIACILASALGFALMAFFVRLCDDFGSPVSSFQKSFFRNFIALLIALVSSFKFRVSSGEFRVSSFSLATRHSKLVTRNSDLETYHSKLETRNSKLLLLMRSVFGCLGIFCNFYAISHIAIADAMALNKTSPFFAVIFSWIFLREKATLRQLACLALAFAGALLVIKPGWREFGSFAALCGLLGGVGAGAAYTCVHQLGRLKVPGSFIVLFFSAFSCLASIPFVLWTGYDPMTWTQVLILVGAGCGAAIGQFGITAAYRFAAPRDIAAFDYSNIVFTALLGFFFFSQIPDAASILGFCAIAAAAFASQK